jgi:hypothetical protein
MGRQAHSYLVGAVSGTTLVATAIVAFVALVSLQAVRDWPLAGLGDGGSGSSAGSGSVAPARSLGAPPRAPAKAQTRGEAGAGVSVGRVAHRGGFEAARAVSTHRAAPIAIAPAEGSHTARDKGSPASAPATSPPAAPSEPSGTAAGGTPRLGRGAAQGNDGVAGSDIEAPVSAPPKVSESVTGAAREVVAGADEATAGALGQTGVVQTDERSAERAPGPETAPGGAVDRVVERASEAVGGLLDLGH